MSGRAQCVRSSPLGAAGPLEMAARAPSELQGRSKWLIDPASEPQGRFKSADLDQAFLGAARSFEIVCSSSLGARSGRSNPLGFAGPIEKNAQVCSVSLEHSNWQVEPARFRWGPQSIANGCFANDRQQAPTGASSLI